MTVRHYGRPSIIPPEWSGRWRRWPELPQANREVRVTPRRAGHDRHGKRDGFYFAVMEEAVMEEAEAGD